MKLVVEVVGAHDLPARRRGGGGGVRPFVQVDFCGQRHATAVKPGEVNPTWNETLVFAVDAATGGRVGRRRLSDRAVDVAVYHRRTSGGKSCLGRVRLFGAAAAPAAEEAVLLRCPLDKPGFFAPARGEVTLRLYMAPYASSAAGAANAPAAGNAYSATDATTSYDGTDSVAGPETVVGGASTQSVHVFHSVPPQPSPAPLIHPQRQPPFMTPPAGNPKSAVMPTPAGVPKSAIMPPPAGVPKSAFMPPQPGVPNKITKKAAPATADDTKAATYLMVDKLEFLYINVVRARALPGVDITLGIDPYVEVRVGNYTAATRHWERNHNPEWNQVFAFAKDTIQSNTVEVFVKSRNLIVPDSFVGKVSLNIAEVPSLAPPNRPLAPQWYGLEGANGQLIGGGEIMLAAWKGSQTDEAFAGALHAGAHHGLSPAAVLATQTKTYYAPRLCYLRCHVIAARDLVGSRSGGVVNAFATVQLGVQAWRTRALPSLGPTWDQDFWLVAAWPFEETLVVTVLDDVAPGRHEALGRLVLPKGAVKTQQFDKKKFAPPPPAWFDLERPMRYSDGDDGDGDGRATGDGGRGGGWRHEFRSKIQLRVYYDAAYHVLDELAAYASDFQPSARALRSPPVGVLELAVLRATGLPSTTTTTKPPANGGGGRRRSTVNAYCVAKYGQKWVRTRTVPDTAAPIWQEQFTFDVFDPCTVLTVAVFDNHQLLAGGAGAAAAADGPLGKVRIRVSTLASGRTYEHPYALFVLRPGGLLQRCGELHLAVRFTPTSSSWPSAAAGKIMAMYLRPQLPNQHFARPIPPHLAPVLRRRAVDVVVARLSRAEPPLRPEAVHYLLRDPAAHPNPAAPEQKAYSKRRSLAACARLRDVLAPAASFARWYVGVRDWDQPAVTALVLLLFLTLTWNPHAILPTFFLYLFAVGAWNFRRRPARPAQMEHHADGVDAVTLAEEFDAGAASGTPPDVVEWRYRRLREVAANMQAMVRDAAEIGERVHGLLSWRDGRATAVALVAVAALAVVFYAVPFRAVVAVAGMYEMRPPVLRRKVPSPLFHFFRRLPTNADVML